MKEIPNVKVFIKSQVSQGGKPYKVVVMVVNGKEVNLGFVNAYTELSLLKAGVKID